MPIQIETQFGRRVRFSTAAGWHIRRHGSIRVLSASSAKGAKIDVAITHTCTEADALLDWLEAAHAASGERKIVVTAREAVIAVRTGKAAAEVVAG